MPRLPVISEQEAVRAFETLGWECVRRHGSHMILAKAGMAKALSIPDHHELGRGLLRDLIRQAELTVSEFVEALEQMCPSSYVLVPATRSRRSSLRYTRGPERLSPSTP